MELYISKSALVAEIEKELNTTKIYSTEYVNGKKYALKKILSFLDTLEVKEVDLEKEIVNQYESNYEDYLTYEEFADISKHFFELGLSVSNSTKVTTPDIDDVLKKWCVNPYSKEAKIIKESYFMALEKLKAQKGE